MRKFLFIIMTSLMVIPLDAQNIVSPNQAMVKHAIEGAIRVICSGYKIKDNDGTLYGRHNHVEFNQYYSIAVVTDSGLIMPSHVLQPWGLDTTFIRYRQSFTPLRTSCSIRQIQDSSYASFPIADTIIDQSPLYKSNYNAQPMDATLSIYSDTSFLHGWLLWVYVSDTLGQAGATTTTAIMAPDRLNQRSFNTHITPPSPFFLLESPYVNRRPIGAVWVIPTYPRIGIVQFCLAAMVVKDDEGWLIASIPTGILATIPQPAIEHNELTPSPE